MEAGWKRRLAGGILRCYPHRLRQRYGVEMAGLLGEAPVRWRDLIDLTWTAAVEWERVVTASPRRALTAPAAAYVVLMLVWATSALAAHGMVYGYSAADFDVDSRFFEMLVGLPLLGAAFFGAALVYNVPLFAVLWLLRWRIPASVGRSLAILGMVSFAMWKLYGFEWFDVWRHGMPSAAYLAAAYLPVALAFGTAGAIVGGAVVQHGAREREGFR
jgi:hypothetical protein